MDQTRAHNYAQIAGWAKAVRVRPAPGAGRANRTWAERRNTRQRVGGAHTREHRRRHLAAPQSFSKTHEHTETQSLANSAAQHPEGSSARQVARIITRTGETREFLHSHQKTTKNERNTRTQCEETSGGGAHVRWCKASRCAAGTQRTRYGAGQNCAGGDGAER